MQLQMFLLPLMQRILQNERVGADYWVLCRAFGEAV